MWGGADATFQRQRGLWEWVNPLDTISHKYAMKYLLATTFLLLSFSALHAQSDYTGALGLRAGPGFGICGKYFLTRDIALEGLFSSRRRGYELTALGLKHQDIGWHREFNWFYGGGAHIGFSEYFDQENQYSRNQTTIGIDGMIGVEYTLQAIPLNIALDYKPEINFSGASGVCWYCGGLSVRYVFD